MKPYIILLAAIMSAVFTSCAGGSSNSQHDSMPGMSAEEHAKMKH